MNDSDDHGVWVRTRLREGGGYGIQILVDDDLVCDLTTEQALSFGREVLRAAAQAQYDAAIWTLAQLPSMEQSGVATVMQLHRKQRQAIRDSHTQPLRFTPGVSLFTGEPFVSVHRGKEAMFQLDVAQAYDHALGVMAAAEGAALDTVLRGVFLGNGFDHRAVAMSLHWIGTHTQHVEVGMRPGAPRTAGA